MTNPFFSIIVPVYKVEQYLAQCVDSLLQQNFDDYEIILVDDGSPDRCPEICDKYAAKYPQIKVLHKSNGGLSEARNKGIEIAQGEYIIFIDSDDFWISNDVLSSINKIIEKNHPDIIVSDSIKYYTSKDKYLYPDKTCDISYNGKQKIEILKYLYFDHADLKIAAWQKFVKRDLIDNNIFTKDLLSEDIDWSLKIYPKAKSIYVYDKPYYAYRQMREGSITNKASLRSFESIMHIINQWKNIIPNLNILKEEKMIYMGYLAYQLSICMLLTNNMNKHEKEEAYSKIKTNLNLFRYPLNFKTKKVALLVNLTGIKNTCKILNLFITFRNKRAAR